MAEVHSIPTDPRFIDLQGAMFDLWTVIAYAGKRGSQHMWLCECKCGRQQVVYRNNLVTGKSGRCVKCRGRNISAAKRGLPYAFPSEFRSWSSMKARCGNPKNIGWPNYGGRGIAVCQQWLNSFANFMANLGPKPNREYEIDRIDNNGNYTPDNCRWATRSEQARNTRHTCFITIDGQTRCLTAWCEYYKMNRKTVQDRISRGWHPKTAFETPARFNRYWHGQASPANQAISEAQCN